MFIPAIYLHQPLHYCKTEILNWNQTMALSRQKLTFERLRRFTLPEGKNKPSFGMRMLQLWHAEQLAEQKPSYSKAFMRENPSHDHWQH